MIKCQVVVEAMDRLAPRYLAENWDNVGLLSVILLKKSLKF